MEEVARALVAAHGRGILHRDIKAANIMIGADGDHDEIILIEQIEEMARLIPHGKLVILSDTSHFALWQDPAAFNKAILDFLAEPAPASAAR